MSATETVRAIKLTPGGNIMVVPEETVDERYARAREAFVSAVKYFCIAAEEVVEARAAYDREWSARRKRATAEAVEAFEVVEKDIPKPPAQEYEKVRRGVESPAIMAYEKARSEAYNQAMSARFKALADEFPTYVASGHWTYAELDRILRARSVTRW